MRPDLRVVLVASVLIAAVVAVLWPRPRGRFEPLRLTYVTTAHQLGVVGYRDPVGAISVDGRRIAFAEGRRLFEAPIGGGARIELAAAAGQIRHIAPSGPAGEWIFEDPGAAARWWIASSRAPMRPLFGGKSEIHASEPAAASVRVTALRQVAASPDGRWIAATAAGSSGMELWRISADGAQAQATRSQASIALPAWTASGDVACTMSVGGRSRLSMPCGERHVTVDPDVDVFGPLAFSPVVRRVFFASPGPAATVDLWAADLDSLEALRLTGFSRDTYAPSAAADGSVLFKTQSYRTSVAELDLASGALQQLSTLQAETPSYHPDGRRIGVTYGTWRRVLDDAKYPDIAQEIGVIRSMPIEAPAGEPLEVVADSDSEDQSMAWSPNGKWIVFHSHREQSDDIWIQPAGTQAPARRVSFLGRGAEVGWPRWSPDGRWVLYDGASPSSGRSTLFVVGIDQTSGEVTVKPRDVAVSGFDGEITHGEWLPDSATIVAIAKEAPGRHAILIVPAVGGMARIVRRFGSEHDFPGLAVAPDGSRVAFVAPAPDGFYQIFGMPLQGGDAAPLTVDRTHKTQPAWSPDGRRLAFTIWSYEAQFWLLPH